jgi:hypothetical protein
MSGADQTDGILTSRRPIANVLIIAAALAVVCCIRIHTFGEPLEADECNYLIFGADWSDGGRPYETIWDNKPIGTFIIYRLAVSVFGYDPATPKLLGLGAMFLVMALLLPLFRRDHADSHLTVGCLLIVAALTNGFSGCHANGANMEIVLLPLLIAAYALLSRYVDSKREWCFWGSIAVLSAAVLVKQVALPFFVVPFLVFSREQWRAPARIAARVAGAVVLVIGVQMVVYAVLGYSPLQFLSQGMQNVDAVANQRGGSLFAAIKTALMVPVAGPIRWLIPFTLTGIVGTLWYGHRTRRVADLLPLMFLGAAAVAIALPGEEMAHYYILALPFIVLCCSTACRVVPMHRRYIGPAVGCIFLLGVVWTTFMQRTPEQISMDKYGGWFLRDRIIGRTLQGFDVGGQRIYVDGSHPGVYVYSSSMPIAKYHMAWTYVTMKVTTQAEVYAQVRDRRPEFCVFLNPLVDPYTTPDFRLWIDENYALVLDDTRLEYRIYQRK